MADARSDKARRLELGRQRRAKTRAKVIAAAFELFGEEDGLYARIEDVSQRAGITRATFYDHFSGMSELREAVTYEVTHDFLTAVTHTVSLLPDPRERISVAIRFYLHRVREVPGWGRSMINLSANGIIFGAETFRQAELTVVDAIAAGHLTIVDSALGRDAILGTTIAAEILGGLALLLGVFARHAAVALAFVLLGTIITVHAANGFFFDAPKGGWEYPAFWIAALVAQALIGEGAFALRPSVAKSAA